MDLIILLGEADRLFHHCRWSSDRFFITSKMMLLITKLCVSGRKANKPSLIYCGKFFFVTTRHLAAAH